MTLVKALKKILTLLLLSGFLMSSCDNTVNPIDQDNGLYSVYGVLVLNDATNTIRIRDLEAPFTQEATEEIDAEVTLKNLETNFIETLLSERIRDVDVYHHNFQVQNVLPDTGYELRIKRSDGRSLELRTKTPSITTKTISPASRDCKTQIEVEFGNINNGDIEYVLSNEVVEADPMSGRNFYQVFYRSPRTVLSSNENAPNRPITFTFRPIEFYQGVNECNQLGVDRLYVTYIYYSEGLKEKIDNMVFDPLESIVRFGAIYIDTLEISFDTTSTLSKSLK